MTDPTLGGTGLHVSDQHKRNPGPMLLEMSQGLASMRFSGRR